MPALARLDALLNRQILTAGNEAEVRRWWRVKVDAKRMLAATPDANVEDVAGRLVGLLGAAA